jgi:hypothetical protein
MMCRDSRAHGANALTLALTYMPADFKNAVNSICTLCIHDNIVDMFTN